MLRSFASIPSITLKMKTTRLMTMRSLLVLAMMWSPCRCFIIFALSLITLSPMIVCVFSCTLSVIVTVCWWVTMLLAAVPIVQVFVSVLTQNLPSMMLGLVGTWASWWIRDVFGISFVYWVWTNVKGGNLFYK